MARVMYDYRFEEGAPNGTLAANLGEYSAQGWDVVAMVERGSNVLCLLRRERDFEVAQSLQTALEAEPVSIEAIARTEIPPS
jgi:hypothetical protein